MIFVLYFSIDHLIYNININRFNKSFASTTDNQFENQFNLPQDKKLQDCTENHVSNGSAIRPKEMSDTKMHHDNGSKVADVRKTQEQSHKDDGVCIIMVIFIKDVN